MTYDREPQVAYIATKTGQRDRAHNTGCFGISPAGRIWWTPQDHPSWRLVPGNGVAAFTFGSYPETVYDPPTDILVMTKSGRVWAQSRHDSGGFDGHWRYIGDETPG